MQVINTMILVMLWLLVAGCSGQKVRENLYKGVYNGSRIENMRGTTPAENPGRPDISYDQYQQQRKEQLKRDPR